MNHNIHPNLMELAIKVDDLIPLPNNPRRGNVKAIKASYDKYGQVKPIIVVDNSGTKTVISGNHQLLAAKELGWTHIAANIVDFDNKEAIEFALVDNRVSSLGSTDDIGVFELLSEVYEDDPEMWETMGWDDFEYAHLEELASPSETHGDFQQGYVAPEVVVQPGGDVETDADGELVWSGDKRKEEEIVTQGAKKAGAVAKPQYTLIFDTPDDQRVWYAFLRVLAKTFGEDGTSAANVIRFIEENNAT